MAHSREEGISPKGFEGRSGSVVGDTPNPQAEQQRSTPSDAPMVSHTIPTIYPPRVGAELTSEKK